LSSHADVVLGSIAELEAHLGLNPG
jgi:hypothetical protein